MIDPSYWFLFPVGIAVSTVAMLAGFGGALFFIIIFVSFLGVNPLLAFASALIIEVFAFGSGIIGYLSLKSINFKIVKKLLFFTVSGVIIGVVFARFISEAALKMLLVILLFYMSYQFLYEKKKPVPKHHNFTGKHTRHESHRVTKKIRTTTFFGGLLLGMISSGLGEINEYNFLKKLQMPVASASGTSIFIVAISAIFGILIHLIMFMGQAKSFVLPVMLNIILFTVPGAVIGAQIGAHISHNINPKIMGKFMGFLLLVAGTVSLIFFI